MKKKLKILLIEDNKLHAGFIKEAFDKSKYNITIIDDGKQALDYLLNPKNNPDVVLLDYYLPSMNGLEILKEVIDSGRNFAFVVLSAKENIKMAVKIMKTGALEFVPKTSKIDKKLPSIVQDVYKKHQKILKRIRMQEKLKNINIELEKLIKKQTLDLQQEINKLKETEYDLRESEKRYRILLENAGEGIIVVINKNIYYVNPKILIITGYSEKEIIGKPFTNLIYQDDIRRVKNRYKSIIKEKIVHSSYEFRILRKNKSICWCQQNETMIEWAGKKAVMSIITDISERKELDRKIFKAIIETEEKERNRFAKDLHDSLGSLLSGIKIYVNHLKSDKLEPSKKQTMFKYINELMDEAIMSSKEIAYDLMPSTLTDFGLVTTLISLCKKIDMTNVVNISLNVKNIKDRFQPDIEVAFFRIIKELINNTLTHSYADKIRINLSLNNGLLTLLYKDNGIGFDVEKYFNNKKKGMGLNNIISRTNFLNGKYEIKSKSSKGKGMSMKIEVEVDDVIR